MKSSKSFVESVSLIGKVILICVFLIPASTFAQKKKKDKLLDGKTYTINLTEKATGKKAPKALDDELSFKSDKFKSKIMEEEKEFGAVNYTATLDSTASEKTITFEAESQKGKSESLLWKGTITGDNVEGTAVWSSKGKIKKEYTFTGSIKDSKKKKELTKK